LNDVASPTEEVNLKPKFSPTSSTRLSLASNITKLDIALMVKDANIFIRKLSNPMFSVTLLRVDSSTILNFMIFFMKLIDFAALIVS